MSDPYYEKNKELVKERSRIWSQKNKEKRRAIRKKWRDANLEAARQIEIASRKKHRKTKSEYQRKNRAQNPGLSAYYCAKRRAVKFMATPKWLSNSQSEYMKMLYKVAAALTTLTEVEYQVDHIVPLQHLAVNGLHVPWNLQVITAEENFKKNNKLDT